MPAVGHVGMVAGEAETHIDGAFADISAQIVSSLLPCVTRRPGKLGQAGPVRTVEGDLGIPGVAARELIFVHEAEGWSDRVRQIHRRRERQGRVGRVRVVGAGRIGPRARRGQRVLVRERPRRFRVPRRAATFAVVEEGEVHTRERGDAGLSAEGVAFARVQGHDAVVVCRLGRDRDVRVVRGAAA